MQPYYMVTFTNVDGAGRYDEQYTDKAEAIAFAQAEAAKAAVVGSVGYVFGYRFRVRRYYPGVYREDNVVWSSADW